MTGKLLKFKACKKFQQNIWLTRKITERQKQRLINVKKIPKKRSNFFYQLQARQLLSHVYGKLPTKYLFTLFAKSYKYKGEVGNTFLSFLERRLDVCLYRLHLGPSLASIRQFIAHGNVCVNDQIVKKPGMQLQPGDIFQIKKTRLKVTQERVRTFFRDQEKLGTLRPKHDQKTYPMDKSFWYKPLHLEINYKLVEGIFLFSPQQIHYPVPMNLDLATKAFQK